MTDRDIAFAREPQDSPSPDLDTPSRPCPRRTAKQRKAQDDRDRQRLIAPLRDIERGDLTRPARSVCRKYRQLLTNGRLNTREAGRLQPAFEAAVSTASHGAAKAILTYLTRQERDNDRARGVRVSQAVAILERHGFDRDVGLFSQRSSIPPRVRLPRLRSRERRPSGQTRRSPRKIRGPDDDDPGGEPPGELADWFSSQTTSGASWPLLWWERLPFVWRLRALRCRLRELGEGQS